MWWGGASSTTARFSAGPGCNGLSSRAFPLQRRPFSCLVSSLAYFAFATSIRGSNSTVSMDLSCALSRGHSGGYSLILAPPVHVDNVLARADFEPEVFPNAVARDPEKQIYKIDFREVWLDTQSIQVDEDKTKNVWGIDESKLGGRMESERD
jgi:hypothetical protein